MKSMMSFCCLLLLSVVFAAPANAQRTPWTTSRLKGTATPPAKFKIARAFNDASFDHPTSISEVPGSQNLLITQMDGKILTVSKADGSKHLVADLRKTADGDVSLFSAVFHPQFQKNGILFTCCAHPEGGRHSRVSRFETVQDANEQLSIDAESETVVITWPAGGHNGGCLQFGRDGTLYISTGDGAGPNPPDGRTTGQTVDDLLGAILRIDVNQTRDGRNYGIPADNPFTARPNARPEIFAYGLRNPWKFGIDSANGDVFVADNGWETWEMVHHVRSGQNCGWPVMEGRAELRSEVPVGPTPIVPPARDHHHSEANSVIGGPVYRGNSLQGLNEHFVYGDYITGTIWALKRSGDNYEYLDVVDTDLRIVDFTQAGGEHLYVLDYDLTGGIYEILPNNVEDLSDSFPRTLADTGLFSDAPSQHPAAGVYAYDVVAPRWQDGAVARRWIAVPGQSQASAVGSTEASYPDGTVFVRHLDIPTDPPTPLETQILHFNNGTWNPYSYLWNADGTEAVLAPPEGAERVVRFPDRHPMTWKTNAVNECRLCHNAGTGFVLGFRPNQLQRKTDSGQTHLAWLHSSGVLKDLTAVNENLALVDPHDESQPLNDRARSYLHSNCSSCHHKGGNAIVSFYLTRDLSFEQMNTNKGTGIGTFGIENAKLVAPGDPYRSVLLYRMSKTGYARMPYIGSQVVDGQGVALISRWIRSLADEPGPDASRLFAKGSSEAVSLETLHVGNRASARKASVENLLHSTEGALALLTAIFGDKTTDDETAHAVEIAKTKKSDVRGLFDTFIPEAERKPSLGLNFDPQKVLTKTGDARRGKLVFFTNNARCRLCHDVKHAEKSMGPTLTEVSKTYPRRSELLQHIMKPSLKIDSKFAMWMVVTTSGRVHSGLRVPSNDGIVLKDYHGKTTTIPEDEIEEMHEAKVSFMPNGVLAGLSAQEAADLLAYIQSL